jgi:hypothetical protein
MLYFKIYLFIFIFIKNYQNPKQKSKTKGVGMVCTVTPNEGWLLPPMEGAALVANHSEGVARAAAPN